MNPSGQNIAAYIRVSSDKQDTQRQRDSISSFADRQGFSIAQWFEDAEGRNPRDQAHKRRAFQSLLKAVQAGRRELLLPGGHLESCRRAGRGGQITPRPVACFD